jgi:predicted outer membrane lipoprotein
MGRREGLQTADEGALGTACLGLVLPFAFCILTFDLLCWLEGTSQMAKGKGQKANVQAGLLVLRFAFCILTFDLLCWLEGTSQMAKGKGQKANVRAGLLVLRFAFCTLTFDSLFGLERTSQMARGKGQKANVKQEETKRCAATVTRR